MSKISREEVVHIARISYLDLHEDEIDPLIDQLGQVISYAGRVTQVAADVQEPSIRNVNVFREDVATKTAVEPIIEQAPSREGNYFIVPVILDSNK